MMATSFMRWPTPHLRSSMLSLSAIGILGLLTSSGCGSTPTESPTPQSPTPEAATPTAVPATPTEAPTAAPATPTDAPPPTPRDTPTPAPETPTPEPTATPVPPMGTVSTAVEVRFDQSGTPHIYAEDEGDLFFAQGYLAARDRLFQLDLTRRQALGTLSEIYGAGRIPDDMISRSFRPIEHAEAELARWQVERPRETAWAEAYAAGVNAYIDDAVSNQNGAELPDACIALNYVPGYLNPTQMLAMDFLFALTLGPSPLLELEITLIGLVVGQEVMDDLLRIEPIEDAYTLVDADLPLAMNKSAGRSAIPSSPAEKQASQKKAKKDRQSRLARFEGQPELKAYLESVLAQPGAEAQILSAIPTLRELPFFQRFGGSNAWAVSGEHTATGAPLLANDTHMGFDIPNTWHQVHVNTKDAGGELNAAGVSAAGAPGFLLGHTDFAGWGVTISMLDLTDLYFEVPTTAQGKEAVLFNNRPVALETWKEDFYVRQGDGSQVKEVRTLKRVPHHGPLLPSEELGLPETLMISLKWVGEQPGSPIGTVYRFLQAESMSEITQAMEAHTIGAGNWVFATTAGDISYDARVRLPIRETLELENPPWEALPGTGGYEWEADSYIPASFMPYRVNPVSGIVASANNDPTGATSDNNPLDARYYYGATFDSGMRARRIDDWLRMRIGETSSSLTWEDMQTLQADTLSMLARHTIPFLIEAARNKPALVTPLMADAITALEGWDHRVAGDSAGAALYMTWWPAAIQEIFEDDLDPSLFVSFTGDVGMYYARPFVHFLESTADSLEQIEAGTVPFPSASGVNFFDDATTAGVVETRDEQLLEALARSVAYLEGKQGSTASAWRWDSLHPIKLNNVQQNWVSGIPTPQYALDGYGFAVDCTDSGLMRDGDIPDEFDAGKVATIKMILDFADGKVKAYNSIPGGQSEDYQSPHYNDQTQHWVDNTSLPLPYTREEVEAATEARWVMPVGFPGTAVVVE